ncbi:MAG: hypothetical protein NDI69_15995 [Bacteriovoracaceae bacterium]|nr:hypothetical protein [Bacteriovoracaceae bacterium]
MYKEIEIADGEITLGGHLSSDRFVKGWVIFAHGSGSSRKSPRNNWVARELNQHGLGTFLFDLLTPEEDFTYRNRFNIPLLARRLLIATQWLVKSDYYHHEPLAYYGASTGAAAALMAAAKADKKWPLFTVISRGGRPDLAENLNLSQLTIPVLLIVGSLDHEVIKLNEKAQEQLRNVQLTLVPGATHLFEEPGALQEVVDLSRQWLERQIGGTQSESLQN